MAGRPRKKSLGYAAVNINRTVLLKIRLIKEHLGLSSDAAVISYLVHYYGRKEGFALPTDEELLEEYDVKSFFREMDKELEDDDDETNTSAGAS